MMNDKYEVVIGLEVHAQLLTKSKLFCGDSTSFGAEPNTHVSPVALAHPGTLPVMNKEVIALAVKLGVALNCKIEQHNYFARKNYFYPDLPKGYQVSQHTAPICNGGYLTIQTATGKKDVQLNRIHMEEDAGKSIHDLFENYTAIDLNRAGTPLLEIVTEPDMHSAEEAFSYLTELRKLVRWLDVCDGNMEEGSLRCDANISVRLKGETTLGTRVEVKNLNSIRNVKKAIEIEVDRLITIVEKGEKVIQETRSFNADNNTSFSLRSKEEADDYRYFPEPDLPPFNITEEYVNAVKKAMPELPVALQEKYTSIHGLSAYDAAMICTDKEDANMYEILASKTNHYKAAANWITGPIRNYCNEKEISINKFPLGTDKISELIQFTETGKIHFNIASTKLMGAMMENENVLPETLAASMNLLQENDVDALQKWVNETIASMPDKVKEYRAGKKGLIGLFAGQVKKMSKGKADMEAVTKMLEAYLNPSEGGTLNAV
ncbi:MAG: Asp-tRNA(Asn)/Glu-tRNA(Gln) amidotransferase subunit GatB [Ferruginibacter sp.]|nr:Asp-tRNA(Asn)/Glu-tRNA(Gln) amidotransferase subunit GatB [Ferruginibacter sp.]